MNGGRESNGWGKSWDAFQGGSQLRKKAPQVSKEVQSLNGMHTWWNQGGYVPWHYSDIGKPKGSSVQPLLFKYRVSKIPDTHPS